jgi:2-alkyl-3-oxoalkanoate reductase
MADRVLVTGATGVVGGAAVRALLAQGHTVVTAQRGELSNDLRELGAEQSRVDIRDQDALMRALQGCDAVVHAAAKVDVIGPWGDYFDINVTGTRSVVAAAQACGVHRFVYVSSPSVAHAGRPLIGADAAPADPQNARSHYSRSKGIAETEVLAADRDDFRVLVLRPHLVWGPRDTQLTARIVQRARAGRLFLIGTGGALIDTTYIDNAGEALAAAVNRVAHADAHGRSFVVSNGEPRTVAEMLTRIARSAGAGDPKATVPFVIARAGGSVVSGLWQRTGRPGEPPMTAFVAEQLATAHWFDQSRVRSVLQWSPRISIDDGFAQLAAWYSRVDVA